MILAFTDFSQSFGERTQPILSLPRSQVSLAEEPEIMGQLCISPLGPCVRQSLLELRHAFCRDGGG
jgi:hypothetical protein